MADGNQSLAQEDKAWVQFGMPLEPALLLEFFQDVERLFRINPYLVFKGWETISAGQYRLHAINHSQAPAFEIDTEITVRPVSNGLEIHYSQCLKSCTRITVQESSEGSSIVIEEEYEGIPVSERFDRLGEVDRSLTKWAEEIQQYLLQWQRWAWFSPWRYYKKRVWQRMKPSARRITFVLLCISAVEIALIGLGLAIYLAEFRK
ncbi:MAG: hypothetical protein F4Y53_05240 [Proteobacteria bacterium]|nr:hypothetical protein [Pseudomonadota bacterium]